MEGVLQRIGKTVGFWATMLVLVAFSLVLAVGINLFILYILWIL